MRLTLESYGTTVTIEVESEEDDFTLGEVIEGFVRPAILAIGYTADGLRKQIGSEDEGALMNLACRDGHGASC